MDKLRACIVANYYANAGMTRLTEVNSSIFKLRWLSVTTTDTTTVSAATSISSVSQHTSKSDPAVLNHPAIRRFLESPSRSSSPLNQGSDTPSLAHSESESLSQQGEGAERDGEGAWREDGSRQERRPGRNTGKVSSAAKDDRGYGLFDEHKAGTRINLASYLSVIKPVMSSLFVIGHIWCAIVHWSRAEGDIPHYWK